MIENIKVEHVQYYVFHLLFVTIMKFFFNVYASPGPLIVRIISGYIDYYSLIVLYGSSIPKYSLPNTFRPTSFLGITGSVFALNFLSSTSCLLSLKKWRRYLKYQWKVELCVVFKILLRLFDCGSNVLPFWNLVFYFQWL